MSKASDTVRMNIILLASLAEDLRHYVPSRQRARCVAQAVARELHRLRLQAALEASAGAWQDAGHPEWPMARRLIVGSSRAAANWIGIAPLGAILVTTNPHRFSSPNGLLPDSLCPIPGDVVQ
jgi:hypothetical protein